MANILTAPLQKILIGLRVKYWNWRIQRNVAMLAELEELQECLQNHTLRDKNSCVHVEKLIISLHHANSSAYIELFKANGVGGTVI